MFQQQLARFEIVFDGLDLLSMDPAIVLDRLMIAFEFLPVFVVRAKNRFIVVLDSCLIHTKVSCSGSCRPASSCVVSVLVFLLIEIMLVLVKSRFAFIQVSNISEFEA